MEVPLPSTVVYAPPDNERHDDYIPAPPTHQTLPQQELGTRPARALPYELHVEGAANVAQGTVELRFRNSGKAAAVFQVRSGTMVGTPWTYTVGSGDRTDDALSMSGAISYNLSIFAPNGFLRRLAGSLGRQGVEISVRMAYFLFLRPNVVDHPVVQIT